MIKTIYSLEPSYEVNELAGLCTVILTFQNKRYVGTAQISPEDRDFFSQKIGLNIATSRAIIKILKDKYEESKLIANARDSMLREAIEYGKKELIEVDPTGAFLMKVIKANKNALRLKKALKQEQKRLNQYIVDVDKTIKTIKRNRDKDKME